jgi:hypothetical protein
MLRPVLLLAALSSACARPGPSPSPPLVRGHRGFSARLSPGADGTWTVDYAFDHARAALVFDSSSQPRATYWTARTGGATIENLHGLDVLSLDPPAPGAHFTVRPSRQLAPDTQPFLRFSDGSVAIHLGQFTVLTVADRAAAEALNGSLRAWHGLQPTVELTVAAREPMLLPSGRRVTGEAHLPVRGGAGYVYVGNIEPVQTKDFVAVIDPGLPGWIATRFLGDLARIYAAHRVRWGDGAARAVILLAFGGTDGPEGKYVNKGFAAGAQLSMMIRGRAYASEDPEALQDLLWFFAHEAAHQFQFRDGVALQPGSGWITEGAANTMATAVLHDLGILSKAVVERRYWKAHRQCLEDLGAGTLENRGGTAPYACGDLIAEMTAASLPDHDLFAFWNALRDEAKRSEHGKLTATRYFALLRARGASSAVVDLLEQLVETRLADPRRTLDDAMRASGLRPVFAGDGGLSTMWFPALGAPP